MSKTLESTIAGSWYPGSKAGIMDMIAGWETSPHFPSSIPNPSFLVLPHAGWEYSGRVAWQALSAIKPGTFKRVVLLAPSHRAWIENRLVAPAAGKVATPLGEIEIDREWLGRLELLAPVTENDRVHLAEHATQIEYPLLQVALAKPFKLVPLIMCSFGRDQMDMCARALAQLMDSETLLVVSSDFTHYGNDFSFSPFGTQGGEDVREKVSGLDHKAIGFIESTDADGFAAFIEESGATICGHLPIELALRALPAGKRIAKAVYATSADGDKDYSRFVCYAAITGKVDWEPQGSRVFDDETRSYLLNLARQSLASAIRSPFSRLRRPADVPKAALAKMGGFVTLTHASTGELRGCIGEIMPRRPLADVVIARSIDSALHDTRFAPVEESELNDIRIEISALTPPEKIASWRDIVLGRDGIILEKNGCSAVFLPQVAPEQGWDLPTTLTYLAMKAGLGRDDWREGADFEVFRAEVFHE